MLSVADGSDSMGSLRNPAGWNNVFGFRPSQGRVPAWPAADAWVTHFGTEGPMARNVRDLALLLDVQAGYDPRAPLSLATEPSFADRLEADAASTSADPHRLARRPRRPSRDGARRARDLRAARCSDSPAPAPSSSRSRSASRPSASGTHG